MAGKSPREAVDSFSGYFEETLSVISADHLTVFQTSANVYSLITQPYANVRTRQGTDLRISVVQSVGTKRLNPKEFKATTRKYSYRLNLGEEHEVLAYHWHPDGSAVRFPHLHLRISQELGYPEIERRIHRAHYPTSRVCIEDFVLLLIDYYDVVPRMPKSQWSRILDKNKSAFEKMATWKVSARK